MRSDWRAGNVGSGSRSPSRARVAGALVTLLLIGCGEAPQEAGERLERGTRPGIRFDPATIRPGDSVGVLVLDSVVARRNLVDSTRVGVARFRGRLELSGRVIRHPNEDLRGETACFEIDAESGARLPRWLHDERRAWFCFTNPREAAAALGPSDAEVEGTIMIDDYTIHRGFSDEVNSARFIERSGIGSTGR